MKQIAAVWLAIAAIAAVLRLPRLADRPMHADEAVLADKFGTLLETGSYQYDPREFHGPLLAWVTLVPARVVGAHRYRDLTEPMLRTTPVLCGLALAMLPLLLAGALGRRQAAAAGALAAVSPAMVYYSRYYIPEMLLSALAMAVVVFGYRYAVSERPAWALAAGAALGLAFATKETAGIAVGAMLIAFALAARKRPARLWPVLGAVALAAAVPLLMLGPANCVQAIIGYMQRGVHPALHRHPWYFYFGAIGRNEAPILILAALGAAAAFRGRSVFLRFVAVYTCALAFAYSVIPYKTPWCALAFLQPAILLAAAGLFEIRRRAATVAVAAFALAWLGFHAWRAAFPLASDPRNPYVYAHTGRDVYAIRDAVARFGREERLQVIGAQNLWPLPWYLRAFHRVEYWRGTGPAFRPAPVILITPEAEPALVHALYEAPPPGERELYLPLFDRYVELRPGVEVRGYVAASLAQKQ